MSQELLYTSAPTGLKSGSRGFATVLCTAGMASNIATRLETLSGYRHVFAPQDPQASLNPVSWSHVRMTINGQPTSILSRIAAYGVDYSGRTNKLAHHVVPSPAELAKAGPAWMLLQSSWVRTDWDRSCQTPASGPALPSGDQPVAICQRWQQTSGDAGWGGVAAEMISSPGSKPLWVVFSIDQSAVLLHLINESIALLPVSQRWRATFSTYYTNLPPEIDCKIRCVLAGTEEAKLAPARGAVIDLTKTLATPPSSAYVETARTGVAAKAKAPMPASVGGSPSSLSSLPLEVINGDDLWPEELLLQPPAMLGKPPALATANKPNLPPQLPGAESHAGGIEGGNSRISWALGTSGLVLILLLLAAIPIIIATKRWSDQITELATNKTKAARANNEQSTERPNRTIATGPDKAPASDNEANANPIQSGASGSQGVEVMPPPVHSEGEIGDLLKVETIANPHVSENSVSVALASDDKNTKGSDGAASSQANGDNIEEPTIPTSESRGESAPEVNSNLVKSAPETKNGGLLASSPMITASLNTKSFLEGKEMTFSFSQAIPISGMTGFFYSKIKDIENLSPEEKKLNSATVDFKNEAVKINLNLRLNPAPGQVSGKLLLYKGGNDSEIGSVLKLGDQFSDAFQNLQQSKKVFNDSRISGTIHELNAQYTDRPILFLDEIDKQVVSRLAEIDEFLRKENATDDEKTKAHANAAKLNEITENAKVVRDLINKINQVQLSLGYLVLNIAKPDSKSLSITVPRSSFEIRSLTFKLRIPD